MLFPEIRNCPGTLAEGFNTYSRTCLKRVYNGKKVNHVLDYDSPTTNTVMDQFFEENQTRMSISGVQEKFSLILDKNRLRLINAGERGTHILKPIPQTGKRSDQMPANEHLTMQLARQVYGIETAENALIFFKNGAPAYITKRFDIKEDRSKRGQEDFASLAGRTPQTHGAHYKYLGNYLELFELMKSHLPAYQVESLKLVKILLFNYLFSNGDAHLKNFSLSETPMGDYRLSPAYDLLNSHIHIEDGDFALEDGLLPRKLAQGKVSAQFGLLAEKAGIKEKIFKDMMQLFLSKSDAVKKLIAASFLNGRTKRSYLQYYERRLSRLSNI